MTEQPETMPQLEERLKGLVSLASDAGKAGDTQGLLDAAGEIASLKKSIESIQKAEKAAKLATNQAEISTILLDITAQFNTTYKGLKKSIARLVELGHDVEIVKFIVDVQANEPPYSQVGPKSKARVSTGTGGNKSKRKVTLADGTEMNTADFVDAYATDEERESKTWTGGWKTALADKIAKRVGATIA